MKHLHGQFGAGQSEHVSSEQRRSAMAAVSLLPSYRYRFRHRCRPPGVRRSLCPAPAALCFPPLQSTTLQQRRLKNDSWQQRCSRRSNEQRRRREAAFGRSARGPSWRRWPTWQAAAAWKLPHSWRSHVRGEGGGVALCSALCWMHCRCIAAPTPCRMLCCTIALTSSHAAPLDSSVQWRCSQTTHRVRSMPAWPPRCRCCCPRCTAAAA